MKISLPKVVKGTESIFFFILALYLLIFIIDGISAIIYPFDLGYVEGYTLNQAIRIYHFENVYNDIHNYPFTYHAYPPLYPLMVASTMPLFGEGFLGGRLITFVSSLLVATLIYKIVFFKTRNHLVSLLSLLIFFSSETTCFWGRFVKPDMTAVLFALIGFYITLKNLHSKIFYLSIPFFLLAIFSKQTFLAAPFSIFIYLLIIKKERRTACIFILSQIFVALMIFFVLNYLTNGQFYLHLVKYNIDPYRIKYIFISLYNFILKHNVLIGFAFFVLIKSLKKGSREDLLIYIYFVSSLTIALLISGGEGGDRDYQNYFIESIAIIAILFGYFLKEQYFNDQIKKDEILGTKRIFYKKLFILLLIIGNLLLFVHRPYLYSFEYMDGARRLNSYVKNAKGDILIETAGFAIVNNKEPLYQPYQMDVLRRAGLWDSSRLLEDIRRKKFSLIAYYWRYDHLPGFNESINGNYKKVDQFSYYNYKNEYKIYVPK